MSDLSELASMADALYALREKRLAAQKEVDAMQAEESRLRDVLIANISRQDATGVSGKTVRVTVVTKPVPQVTDWDELLTFVRRRGAWDILQRRISDTAVKARWEDGVNIPGVGVFNATTLSMNKV